ncbi:ABC transporter permease subunit [Corynebacterium diphtheriae]|uniref:ABC transporter permease subunit n=1 Tax=Corynebacterium diphtheriae TaxID=1717 RepID=UPI0018CAABF5|nr:ABC transporter permease subunit [Corynebacterium diphtheriae]MBG9292719.1 ABC transporter permease subunit [Corynebacterium diphtheriae bv. gravis]MBG9374370.1 ABC transporter permease subunit [Corynebacterium diphtheriae bv. gravis]
MTMRSPRTLATVIIAVATYALALVATALLPWFTGREPAFAVLRAREREREATPELLQAIREQFDLPRTPWESVSRWFAGVARGDFGTSWVNPAQGAWAQATHGLGITATLTFVSTVLCLIVALLIVMPRIAAAARGRRGGVAAPQLLAALAALPDFVVAVILLWLCALVLHILPVGGWSSPAHMVLPSLALGVCAGGVYGRVLLITADSASQEPWVEAWRINGVAHSRITRVLLWRSFVPTIPLLTLFFAGTLASTAAVEVTFNIPGFGRTVVNSALNADLPVLQAAVFVVLVVGALSGIVANTLRRIILRRLEGDVAGVSLSTGTTATSVVFDRVSLIIAAIPLVAVAAGMIRSAAINTDDRFASYSAAHPLGADQLGRDIWARLADGFTYSIGVAVLVTALCALIGLIAGHLGSWVLHIGDALNAFPAVLLGLILAGALGPSTTTAAIAVLMVGWIPLASHCAAVVQEARASGHYRYAATMGASRWHLLRHHVLPWTTPAVIRHAVVRIAHNAISLAALGYLGVGASVGSPDWGVILEESTHYLERAPWMAIGPMLCLVALGVVAAVATDSVGRRQASSYHQPE